MHWVVKWRTLRRPKLIRIGPQGAHLPEGPNERPKPTCTGLSNKVLQMKTRACQACFPRWKPTKDRRPIQGKSHEWKLGPVKSVFLNESPQKGQSTTSLPIIKASPCKTRRISLSWKPFPYSSIESQVVFHTLRLAAPIQSGAGELASFIEKRD